MKWSREAFSEKTVNSGRKPPFQTVVVILLIMEALALIGIAGYLVLEHDTQPAGTVLEYEEAGDGQYVLYIGLNDKDTYEQIIPTGEAKDIVNRICTKYVDGYTASEANGGWVDETGALTEESTLVYMLSDTKEENVIAIMDEVLAALNQNSILVERREYAHSFYSGK